PSTATTCPKRRRAIWRSTSEADGARALTSPFAAAGLGSDPAPGPRAPILTPTSPFAAHREGVAVTSRRRISLIGAPTDIGAGSRGSSMGPEALRVANIGPVLEGHGFEVIDRGNL